MGSSIFWLDCQKCSQAVIQYRKKGSGALIRAFIDCIVESHSTHPENLSCPACQNLLGKRIKVDKREAYRLIPGSYKKRV